MKVSYLVVLFSLFLLPVSCNSKNKSVEVEVADWGVVEHEVAIGDEIAVADGDTTIYREPATTATLENHINYLRNNNRLKDRKLDRKKKLLVRAIIEKDGTPTQVGIMMYQEADLNSEAWKKIDNWKEDEFTAEAIRLVKEAKIEPATNESGTPVRSEWVMMVAFPPN